MGNKVTIEQMLRGAVKIYKEWYNEGYNKGFTAGYERRGLDDEEEKGPDKTKLDPEIITIIERGEQERAVQVDGFCSSCAVQVDEA